MQELPGELFALIFDCLGDDESYFSSLALVSRQFLTLVRERRGSVVIGLSKRPVQQDIQMLNSIIEGDPTFAPYITSLTLLDTSDPKQKPFGWFTWGKHKAFDYRDLPKILQHLVSLKALTLANNESSEGAVINWEHLLEDIQVAFFNLFSLSSLEELRLDGIINMELTPLVDCSNLKRLTVKSIRLSANDLEPLEVPEPSAAIAGIAERGQLEYLEVGDCGIALSRLIDGLSHPDAHLSLNTSLTTLKIHTYLYDDAMESALKTIIQQCKGSIKEIQISASHHTGEDTINWRVLDSINCDELPLLNVLEIEIFIPMNDASVAITEQALSQILKFLHPSASDSKHLRFTLRLPKHSESTNLLLKMWQFSYLAQYILGIGVWEGLEEAVANTLASAGDGAWRASVEVVLVGSRKHLDVIGELYFIARDLEEAMPTLVKQGALNVYWIHPDGSEAP